LKKTSKTVVRPRETSKSSSSELSAESEELNSEEGCDEVDIENWVQIA